MYHVVHAAKHLMGRHMATISKIWQGDDIHLCMYLCMCVCSEGVIVCVSCRIRQRFYGWRNKISVSV
jgi:hypothetical protein